jgi:hypothetical protein
MRRRVWQSLLVGTSLVLVVGCATKEEWDIWRSSNAQFASKEHMEFSLKNRGGKSSVSRSDLDVAKSQNWFGKAVTVAQESILER